MQEESLRERKKARTWHDIHVAAAEAVLERGLQAVTVEDIAASVGISQRTFFNYFPTKDHAVMGVREPIIPEGVAERPPEGASTLRGVVELYMQLVASAMPANSANFRVRLMQTHPDLGRLLKDTMHGCEHMVRDVVHGWAEQGLEPRLLGPGHDLDERISMLVLTAGAALRFVFSRPGRVPGADPSPEDLDHAVDVLVSLIRTDHA